VDSLLGISIGIGLSAACGFRVFVPLLVMSIFALSGHLNLSPGFSWIGSYPALVAFATATAVEVAAYLIPGIDNLLDLIATPAAVIAGTLVTASFVTDLSPFLKWTLALIAGGGAAGIIQGGTVLLRGKSTLSTGGAGNPFLTVAEGVASAVLSILAVLIPVLAGIVIIGVCIYILWRFSRALFRKYSDAWPLGGIAKRREWMEK
jgi:hypothetical protein